MYASRERVERYLRLTNSVNLGTLTLTPITIIFI